MNVDYIRSRIKDKKSLILFDNAYEFASKRLMGVVYNENQSLMNYLLEIIKFFPNHTLPEAGLLVRKNILVDIIEKLAEDII